ncbi:hypothetical protein BVY03_00830, partial [bacterium K02(2017)]
MMTQSNQFNVGISPANTVLNLKTPVDSMAQTSTNPILAKGNTINDGVVSGKSERLLPTDAKDLNRQIELWKKHPEKMESLRESILADRKVEMPKSFSFWDKMKMRVTGSMIGASAFLYANNALAETPNQLQLFLDSPYFIPSIILNGGFEEGTVTGWEATADYRTLAALGDVTPQSGSYMGVISTGLGTFGSSLTKSSLTQTMCIP